MKQIQKSIKRIEEMEREFDLLLAAFSKCPDVLRTDINLKNIVIHLTEYLSNGAWLQDYELNEKGLLPKDMKKGVLSEDGLYNLLCDIKEFSIDIKS